MLHGNLVHPVSGEGLDDVMLGIFRGPRSYTGEEMVEIYAHGSVPGLDRIFEMLFLLGFRQAMGGEFTLRAFLNGKLDLTRAEAIQEIVSSQSRTAQALALHRLGGAVQKKINYFKAELLHFLAAVSLQIDYPEDEVDDLHFDCGRLQLVRSGLETLARTYNTGRVYQQGVRLVLAGRTNAGKSSLFNTLVREERAIVSEIHGTTRDYLEAPFAISGIPVRLFDTAGLREVEEVLEAEGIRRSSQVIDSAALVLYVIDSTTVKSEGLFNAEDQGYLASIQARNIPVLVVWNKIDASGSAPVPENVGLPVLPLSAHTLQGIDELLQMVANRVLPARDAESADVLINSERQYQLLKRAIVAVGQTLDSVEAGVSMDLLALDLQDALAALGEITGEVTSEDILETMFSHFCVGK